MLVSLILFSILGRILYSRETAAMTLSFQNLVDRRAAVFEREVKLNLEILFALKSGLVLMPELTPESFRALTGAVLERSPEIQAFAWAPWVILEDKEQFERSQQSSLQGFALKEQNSEGVQMLVAQRPWYVPVHFIEPVLNNRAARGFDLASEPSRHAALLEARDSGMLVATAGITLVQETGTQLGILVFAPVYRGSPATPDERRDAISGFLNGVFRIGDLFNRTAGTGTAGNILFRVIDRTDGREQILHVSSDASSDRWVPEMAYSRELMDIAGRRWVIEALPARAYIAAQRSYLPQLVTLSGALLVALLVVYALMTLRRNAELKVAKRELERVSMTDSLTGLANRRHFDWHLGQEWDRARRDHLSVSLIMIDIDYFKPFNDEYGHPAGDQCLKQVSNALSKFSRRPVDLVARYGGEEFAIILPQTDDPLAVAENCRATIERLKIGHGRSPISAFVTISVGVCTVAPVANKQPDLLTQLADDALYRAKHAGRNRVVSAPEADSGPKRAVVVAPEG